jgi:rhodanese-related sulfurtransferase
MQDITVQELHWKLENGSDFLLLDVREPYEYEEFNLRGKLIPLGALGAQLDELESYKDAEIVVHCRSGGRSAAAKALLQAQGFHNVRNLLGGTLAWLDAYGAQVP